jgi:myo-inositol 2-dehydrogenase / D-chiro-inositol 1-dehydrogenase
MRVGVIGAGRIGALHAANLADLTEIDEVVITDRDHTRAVQLGNRIGAATTEDAAAAVDAGIDAAVIATPTPTHADLVLTLARAGLPVFCEKPVASDVASTIAVLKEVEAAGTALQVGFQRRFDAGYQALRDAVRAGRLGRLHGLHAVTADPAPPHASYIASSGGIFRDCSVHDFDAIRWVTGREIVEVYATGSNSGEAFFADTGDVDTGVAALTLEDGTLATVYASRYNGAGYDVRLEVSGVAGTLVAGLDGRAPLLSAEPGVVSRPGAVYQHFGDRFAGAYRAELRAFVDVVAGRIGSPCTGEEALEALLVADAAELSRAERRPVRVEEVRAAL